MRRIQGRELGGAERDGRAEQEAECGPGLAEAGQGGDRDIDRPELAADPRFATAEQIAAHTDEGVKILQEAIATRTLAEWTERFATLAGPWAPVQDTLQAASDAQVQANEYILPAGELELASSPVQFDVTAPQLRPGPEFAAQTEEILLELGLDWDRITALKDAGAVT